MAKQRINVTLDEETLEYLKQVCEREKLTMSAVITMALNEKRRKEDVVGEINLDDLESKVSEINEFYEALMESHGKKRRDFGQHSIVEIKKESEPAVR